MNFLKSKFLNLNFWKLNLNFLRMGFLNLSFLISFAFCLFSLPIVGSAGPSRDEVNKWENSSSSMIEAGKVIYSTNCSVCHGAGGKGDGVAGVAMKQRPRDLTSNKDWVNGTSAQSIYVTLSKGLKGTLMAGFPTLSAKDRWSLVHFVRSLVPNPSSSGKADKQYESVLKEIDRVGMGNVTRKTIPLKFAVEQLMNEGKE